jgi:hypothetical protein
MHNGLEAIVMQIEVIFRIFPRGTGKSTKNSSRNSCATVEFRTRDLPNNNLYCWRYTRLSVIKPLISSKSLLHMEERRYIYTLFYFGAIRRRMMKFKLRSLYPRRFYSILFEQEGSWTPQPVWNLWSIEKFLLLWGTTARSFSSKAVTTLTEILDNLS